MLYLHSPTVTLSMYFSSKWHGGAGIEYIEVGSVINIAASAFQLSYILHLHCSKKTNYWSFASIARWFSKPTGFDMFIICLHHQLPKML